MCQRTRRARGGSEATVRIAKADLVPTDLPKLHGPEQVGRALAACADAGRFGEGDLAAILTHQTNDQDGAMVIPFPAKAAIEEHTLQRSTRSWEGSDDEQLPRSPSPARSRPARGIPEWR